MLILAVSSCLLGNPVRYDGRSKGDPAIIAAPCRLIPFCPECGCGMPVPRPPIHCRGDRLTTTDGQTDWSNRMEEFVRQETLRLRQLGINGAILKSRSPSCGLTDTPQFDETGRPTGTGAGFFAARLHRLWPELPLIDEIAWNMPEKRAEFLSAACNFGIL